MKSLLFIAGLVFVLSSFASELERNDIQDFEGSYLQDRGNASAKVWHLAGSDREENISFEVFKENQQIRLVTPQEEFFFDEVPEFILELTEVRWRGVDAQTAGQSVSLELASLQGSGAGQSLNLQRLQGNCQGSNLNGDFFQNLIAACTSQGNLGFKSLVTRETLRRNQSSLYQFLESILMGTQKNSNQSTVTLEDFDLKVRNKRYNLKVKADLSISATIKAEGSFDYQQDRVRIRIDKVKASFLTITGKVFDELEKIQSPNVIVNRPFVTILF
jgi:hypothetical protein